MAESIKFGTDGWRAIIADEFTYANVRRMIDRIPTGRPRGDEPAHVFVPGKFMPVGE